MTKQVQRRRGTSTQHTSFTGAEGEISVNTTNKSIHVHDGTTAGGVEAARADLANVSDTSLNNALSGNTLASLTITSADINGGTIDGTTIGGTSAAAVTTTSLVATTADINGGTVDGAVIGGSSAAAITGTTITATGDVTIADKIIHAGDTNTAIRFPAADTVTVETAGAERLRVDSEGRVGIGATTLDAPLTIKNPGASGDQNILTVQQNGAGTNALAKVVYNQTDDSMKIINASTFAGSYMGFWTSNTERARIDSSGNLGIGTTSPALVWSGDARVAHVASTGTTAAGVRVASANASAELFSSGGTTEWGLLSASNAPFVLYTNNAERLRIDASGNLGLGVTPSAWAGGFKALQVAGSSSAAFSGDTASAHVTTNTFYDGSNWKYIASAAAMDYYQFGGQHVWRNAPSGTAGNAITFTQAMTLDASGNLLVGTTTAGYSAAGRGLLEVNGSSTALIGLKTGGTNRGYLYTQGTDMIAWAETGNFTLGTAASAFVAFTTNNTERVRIDASGNLLVGTTSGSSHRIQKDNAGSIALQVYNQSTTNTSSAMELNVNYTGNTSGWFVRGGDNALYRFYIYSNGNMVNSNNSYGAISDARLKENVTDATPKLDKLCQVRVINYNLIGDEKKQIGVIAQELEQIFPSMVEETPDRDAEGNDLGTTTKSVKYSVFVPMLIKAMQEQQAIIEALEARITALEA